MTGQFSGLYGHPAVIQAEKPSFQGFWTRASHLDPLTDLDLVEDELLAHEIAEEHGLEMELS